MSENADDAQVTATVGQTANRPVDPAVEQASDQATTQPTNQATDQPVAPTSPAVDPGLLVDLINATSGGAKRPVHAVGIGLQGMFTPALGATSFCSAAVFAGPPVPVTARFSNGSGVTPGDDRTPDVRGLAVRFHLGNTQTSSQTNSRTNSSDGTGDLDLVAMTLNGFFARTPEEFVEFLEVTVVSPETGTVDGNKLGAWLYTHPSSVLAFLFLQFVGVDVTYGGLSYYGVHAFGYTNGDGVTTMARFSWVPDQPVEALPRDTDTTSYTKDYLRRDITQRARNGKAPGFSLVMQVQGPGDLTDDPTQVWTSTDRRTLGHLQLGALVSDQYWGCEALRFNPTRVIKGIALSDDPILAARQQAYATSAGRRTAAYPPPAPASVPSASPYL